jgi:hypothetical protein
LVLSHLQLAPEEKDMMEEVKQRIAEAEQQAKKIGASSLVMDFLTLLFSFFLYCSVC